MLNLPQKTLNNIKRVLLRKKKEVEEELEQVQKDDPAFEEVAEVHEPGSDSWVAEGHARVVALGEELKRIGGEVSEALGKIRKGIYGHCESCKKHIETTRLLVMPTARYCLSCSKKKAKK